MTSLSNSTTMYSASGTQAANTAQSGQSQDLNYRPSQPGTTQSSMNDDDDKAQFRGVATHALFRTWAANPGHHDNTYTHACIVAMPSALMRLQANTHIRGQ